MSLLEAMTCGLPVVSTDCPAGPAYLLEQGARGLLVPVDDHDAFAEAVIRIARDDELRDGLIARWPGAGGGVQPGSCGHALSRRCGAGCAVARRLIATIPSVMPTMRPQPDRDLRTLERRVEVRVDQDGGDADDGDLHQDSPRTRDRPFAARIVCAARSSTTRPRARPTSPTPITPIRGEDVEVGVVRAAQARIVAWPWKPSCLRRCWARSRARSAPSSPSSP